MATALTYPSTLLDLIQAPSPLHDGEPAWLQTFRKESIKQFLASGLPTPKNEEWKYTPLREIAETDFLPGEPGPAVFDEDINSIAKTSSKVVLTNGRLDRNLSEIPVQAGLTVCSLRDAISQNLPLVQEYLGKIGKAGNHPFAALNGASFVDGLFIHLGKATELSDVLEIIHITSGDQMVIAPRILIIAEAGSKGKIVERYLSDGQSSSLTIPVTEVLVQQGAELEHVRFQEESTSNFHLAQWDILQEDASEYRSYNVCFGAKTARTDQNIWLGGENIITRLDGVVIALEDQHIDNHTRLDHAMPNCNSFEIYKQIAGGKGTIVFNGKIFVHQDAQKTDAEQRNQALLLSPTATINSKPQLEIFADDVKCTHGATVGQLEDTPLFYLQSRGLERERAQALLVYAFAADVLELISIDEVRLELERRLFEKLVV